MILTSLLGYLALFSSVWASPNLYSKAVSQAMTEVAWMCVDVQSVEFAQFKTPEELLKKAGAAGAASKSPCWLDWLQEFKAHVLRVCPDCQAQLSRDVLKWERQWLDAWATKGEKRERAVLGAEWPVVAAGRAKARLVEQRIKTGNQFCAEVTRLGQEGGWLKDYLLSAQFVTQEVKQWMNELSGPQVELCRRRIIQFYLDEVKKEIGRNPCQKLDESCSQILKRRAQGVFAMKEWPAVQAQERDQWKDAIQEVGYCVQYPQTRAPLQVLDALKMSLPAWAECVAPKVGEGAVRVSTDQTGLSAVYDLTKKSDSPEVWEVGIPLQFRPASKHPKMKRVVQECWNRSNRLLIGPKGEKIRLVLIDERVDLPAQTVDLEDLGAEGRANRGLWQDLTLEKGDEGLDQCPTMTHEMLHLLGLVDEYPEALRGYVTQADGKTEFVENCSSVTDKPCKLAYDCRSLGPDDSMMSNHEVAYEQAEKAGTSILKPAHFKWITQPGCALANQRYLKCARGSYDTSTEHGGTGCSSPPCGPGDSWLQ